MTAVTSMGNQDADVGKRSRCSTGTGISPAAIPNLLLSLEISQLPTSPQKSPDRPPAGGAKSPCTLTAAKESKVGLTDLLGAK